MAAAKGNNYAKGNKGGGRLTAYKEDYPDQAYKFCLLGATDAQLGEFFGVSETTINNWKEQYQEFSLALKRGKMIADAEIANSLFQRAKGYSHPEIKVFQSDGEIITHEVTKHYPPDTGAAFIWLKNRQPTKWRDKSEQEIITRTEEPSLEEIEQRLVGLRSKTGG